MALTFNLSLLAVVLCREREFSNVLRALCFVKSTNLRIYLFPGKGVSDYSRCLC